MPNLSPEQECQIWIDDAISFLKTENLPRPEVKFSNQLVTTAGQADNRLFRIKVSARLWDYSQLAERRDTIIHEYCHLAGWKLSGTKEWGHGPIWKNCMQLCGLEPKICHNIQVAGRKEQTVCVNCAKPYVISNRIKSKIARDVKQYCCPHCKFPIVVELAE